MEKNYVAPEAKIVTLNVNDPLAQEIPIGGDLSQPPDAKENKDVIFEEEETLPIGKNIWDDEE